VKWCINIDLVVFYVAYKYMTR